MEIFQLINDPEPLEPETLDILFPSLSPSERELALVLKVIKNTNAVFEDFDVFENAVSVLNGISPNIEIMEGSLPEWIWYALNTIKRLRPDMKLSEEVNAYIKYIFKENGIFFSHPLMEEKNNILSEVVKKSLQPRELDSSKFEDVQTYKYLRIKKYVDKKESNN